MTGEGRGRAPAGSSPLLGSMAAAPTAAPPAASNRAADPDKPKAGVLGVEGVCMSSLKESKAMTWHYGKTKIVLHAFLHGFFSP